MAEERDAAQDAGASGAGAAPRAGAVPRAGAAPHPEPAPLTEELLERLLASASPEAYLDTAPLENRTLAEYLTALLEQYGLKRSQVIRASGLGPTFCYQIFQGVRGPGRDSAIMLALGMGLSLRECQRLLRLAGLSELWPKIRRDAIIIHCIEAGLSRVQVDDELWRLGEPTLLKE